APRRGRFFLLPVPGAVPERAADAADGLLGPQPVPLQLAVVRRLPGHRGSLRSTAVAGAGPGDGTSAVLPAAPVGADRWLAPPHLKPRGCVPWGNSPQGSQPLGLNGAAMKGQAFLRHAAVYGAASLLLQAAGFVLLPLYTRCLGPRDFGVL